MDPLGFLILILKCNQDIEMMKQYITDSNIGKKKQEMNKGRKKEKRNKIEKKEIFSLRL